MGIPREWRAVLGPSINAGLWAVVFLDDRTGPALLAVPVLMAAVMASLHRPLLGVVLLGGAHGVTLAAGVGYGGMELLVGSMVVLGWAGRYGAAVWPGLFGIALSAVLAASRDGFEVRKLVVTSLIFGFGWLFGRLVRHRALAATAALAEAERLASADPRALAHPRTAAERRRIAESAAVDLRAAVHTMLAEIDALLAGGTPQRHELGRIRESGARTVEELRRMLVVLRAEPTPPPVAPPRVARGHHVDLVMAAVAAVITGALLVYVDGWAAGGWLPLAYGGLVTALALRSSAPLIAGVVLAAAMLPLAVHPPPHPDALLPVAGGIAVILWTIVDHAGLWSTIVNSLIAVSALGVGSRYGLDGVAFIVVVLTVSLAAALAWGEPDRMLIRARERSGVLRDQLEAATAEAVRQERLRIARDLHDTTSHAVGVMLMQVSAAEAQITTHPAKALAALATAREAGARAREASMPLLPRLHGGAPRDAGSLEAELEALVAQWRATGMEITAEISPPALLTPEIAATCYRIVQEALTNSARHAPGSTVSVRVVTNRRHLIVEVEDTGATRAVSSTPSGGWGLSGLRERVHPGHFSAGPHGRGYRVAAHLSLISAARSTP